LALAEHWGSHISYARKRSVQMIVFSPDQENMNSQSIYSGAMDVLHAVPTKKPLQEKTITPVVHIEKMMDTLVARIQHELKVNFNSFFGARGTIDITSPEYRHAKVTLVVGFLAMLEMVRNGFLQALQSQTFDDIMLSQSSSSDIVTPL